MDTGWFFCLGAAAALALLVPTLIFLSWAYGSYRGATNGRPWQWWRARRGWGKPLAELARRLDLTVEELQAIEPSYKETFIQKKRGGAARRLLIPDPRLQVMQRRILRRLLNCLRAHPAATGFERGKSIVHNAIPHVGKRVVIKMDVIDFFPTTRAARIEAY